MEGKISFEELEASATPAAAATPQVTTEAAPPVVTEEAKPQFTESDVEAYRSLVDMGITPQNAADFKAAKEAMTNLPLLLKSPEGQRMLLDEIQKNDPATYSKLLETASDRWFNELPEDVKNSGNNSGSRTTNSTPAVDPKLTSIEAKIDGLIQERNQEKTSKQQSAITQGYETAVDDLLKKLPEATSDRDKDYLRLKTNELIWKDPKAREAVAKGVYVDVPKYFSKASSLVTAETKAAANAEHDRRAGVEARGSRTIAPAAEATNGTAPKREGHGADPIWGDISDSELKSAFK
jgi:hypothetical protein